MNDQVLLETKLREWVRFLRLGLVVLAAAGVLGIVILVARNRSLAKSEEAYGAFFEAERMEMDAANEALALKVTPQEAMKKWTPEKKKDYEQKISAVISGHEGTTAAAQAALKLARWKFDEGRLDESLGDYTRALEVARKSDNVLFAAMAYEGIGSVQEAQRNFEGALKTYGDALALKDNPLKPLAYFGQARVQTALGKQAEAKAAYEEVLKQFPNSRYERRARALQALLPGA
jgi:tetratricopeptide (TPR) repeat protein